MAVNDIYRITLGTQWGNQAGLMVSHWVTTAEDGNGASQQEIANKFDTEFRIPMLPLLHVGAFWYGAKAQKIYPGGAAVPSLSTAPIAAGTGGLAGLPPQVSGLITLRTAFAGRAYRGRQYVPFPSEQASDDTTGRPTTAYNTALNGLAAKYVLEMVVGASPNVTRLRCGIFRRSNNTINYVLSTSSRGIWATQRRRGDFGRTNPSGPF
jgi:hypothetical protein